MRAILRRGLAESRAPVILCPIPTFCHIDKCFSPEGYLRRFGEVGAGRAEVIDILPEFWKLPSSSSGVAAGSPSTIIRRRLGHEVIARAPCRTSVVTTRSWEQRRMRRR